MIHPGCDDNLDSPIFDVLGGVILGRDKQMFSRSSQEIFIGDGPLDSAPTLETQNDPGATHEDGLDDLRMMLGRRNMSVPGTHCGKVFDT
jgi:hypothetical protein